MGAVRCVDEIPLLLMLFDLMVPKRVVVDETANSGDKRPVTGVVCKGGARGATLDHDIVRWGVWLGRHIC